MMETLSQYPESPRTWRGLLYFVSSLESLQSLQAFFLCRVDQRIYL